MRRLLFFSLAASVLAFGASAAQAKHAGTTVSLVVYSAPKLVTEKLVARFEHQPAGRGVTFTRSYGPSGTQARAIAAGLPADVAFLATGLDIYTLVDAGLVPKSWQKAPFHGIAAGTVVAFAVRPGNPKHIRTWKDLVKPGVQVVTPNPFSSGGAKWNILAAYGAMRKTGKTNKQAVAFVTKLFRHVVSQDSSAANAMNTFFSGKGDVLITYEAEAYAAIASHKRFGLVIPRQTMLIELPMVALKNAPAAAKAFVSYVHNPKQQAIFAKNGYRPVVESVLKRPDLTTWRDRFGGKRLVFAISDKLFGGWLKADKVWFDPNTGRMVKIEQQSGGPGPGG